MECHKASRAAWRKANLKNNKTYGVVWRKANLKKHKTTQAAWYRANSERAKTTQAAWGRANPDKVNAKAARRHAAKLQRTPPWLTKEHHKQILEWYTLAYDLQWLAEEPLEVDHTIPLRGKNVSGLHVPWNLQILSKSQNISKGNKF